MSKHIYKLVAKDDGLWLELNSPSSKKSAIIQITKPNNIGIVKTVIEEVWLALRKKEKEDG